MSAEYPSILVLSPNTFNYLNGTGVTFSHLFSGWPKDCLANLHSSDEPEDKNVCERFFRMGPAELRRLAFAPKKPQGGTTAGASAGESVSWKKRLAGNSGWPEHFHLSEELKAWLSTVRPEIIYTVLGPIPFMEAALKLRDQLGAKLVVHHMDDWYKDAYTTGLFRFQRRKMLRLFHSVVDSANKRLAICEDMATEYSQRYSNTFVPFQNTIDVKAFRQKIDSHLAGSPGRKSILYFGSILPFAQQQSVQDTAEAVARLWQKNPGEAPVFRIVAPRAQLQSLPEDFQKRESLSLEEMRNEPEQFEKEIAAADALLLPANFGLKAIQHLRFSMPTKLPGYLASGKPVLVYCHEELAQARYLKRHQMAEIVSERSEPALLRGIERVLDPAITSSLTTKAFEVALENHDSTAVRSRFHGMLKKLPS